MFIFIIGCIEEYDKEGSFVISQRNISEMNTSETGFTIQWWQVALLTWLCRGRELELADMGRETVKITWSSALIHSDLTRQGRSWQLKQFAVKLFRCPESRKLQEQSYGRLMLQIPIIRLFCFVVLLYAMHCAWSHKLYELKTTFIVKWNLSKM